MLVIFIIKFLCVVGTLYICTFALWRILEREHVEEAPLLIDRVFVAGIVAAYFSRLPTVLDLLIRQEISVWQSINPLIGVTSWQVGIVLFCIILAALLREHWRDRAAVLDFVVNTVCVFLIGLHVWSLATELVFALLRGVMPSVGSLLMSGFGVLYFIGLGRLLAYFERQYRAYFWYRYRRSSAQTGFVTSVFLIGCGLYGVISSLRLVPFALLGVTMFLTIWSLFTGLGGLIFLYIRSGRLKKK